MTSWQLPPPPDHPPLDPPSLDPPSLDPQPSGPPTADRVAWRLEGLLGARGRSRPDPSAIGAAVAGEAADPASAPAPGSGPDPGAEAPPVVAGRRTLHRVHLMVIGLVLVVGLAVAGWSVLRARAVTLSVPLAVTTPTIASAGPGEPSEAPASAVPTADRAPTASAPRLVVHVLGAVRHPGLVRLSSGARVQDAIRAAGGLRRDADHDQLNLARVLLDGQQVVIGTRRHPRGEVRDGGGAGPGARSGDPADPTGEPVDLNQATAADLDALPGVGPVTAERILAWRSAHGRFTRVTELQEVDGIGPKTYARLAPHVRV